MTRFEDDLILEIQANETLDPSHWTAFGDTPEKYAADVLARAVRDGIVSEAEAEELKQRLVEAAREGAAAGGRGGDCG